MFIWLHCIACGVLVPQSGIKPVPLAVEVWSLNHWTTIRRRFLYPEKVYLTGKISPVQVNVWLDKLTQNNKIFHSRKIYQLSMRARAAYPSSCSNSVLTKQLSWTSLVAQTVKHLYSVGDPGSIPALGRSPGEGNGNPLQNSCLENPMDGSVVGYSLCSCKESDMTDFTFFLFFKQLS